STLSLHDALPISSTRPWKTSISTSAATSWSGSGTRSTREEPAARGSVLVLPAAHPRSLEDISLPFQLRLHRLRAAARHHGGRLPHDVGSRSHSDADRLARDRAPHRLHRDAVPGR